MIKRLVILPLLFLAAALPVSVMAQNPAQEVIVLHADGVVNPVLADYIERGISLAEEENAAACVIELNTPGGLLDSTEKIVTDILNASVPVIVYVSPKGGWAASAGVFITLSAHIAAMTPGTTIGAAHPVSGGGEELTEDELEKITNFSAKWLQTIAEERGRNTAEAELAVTQSKSFSDTEALAANLIDIRAEKLPELLSAIDGREIKLADGRTVNLHTAGVGSRDTYMTWIEQFLYAITDPNIAYILLSLAILGITVEIFNPGLIFPGVAGGIAGLLAFYSLGMLPVNYTGILLIVLAFAFFILEAFVTSYGVLTAGGLTSLVIGSLILFKGGPLFRVNIGLIITVSVIIAAFLVFVVNRVVAAHRRQASTGREELPGKTAIVRTSLDPEGIVFYQGELWSAVLDEGRAAPGEEVTIHRQDGLKLYVTKKSKGGS